MLAWGPVILYEIYVTAMGVCWFPEGLRFLFSARHPVSSSEVLCPVVGEVVIPGVRSNNAAGRGGLLLAVCPLVCSCCCGSGFEGYVR